MNIKKQIKNRKNDIIYTTASIISPIIGMLASIVAARYIAPSDMGYIQSVLLITTYLSFLNLGVFNGLNRDIAYYKSKDSSRVQSLVDTSYFVAFIISAVCSFCCLTYVIYCIFIVQKLLPILSSVLLFVSCTCSFLTTHLDTTFRSGQEFKVLGFIKIKESIVSTITIILPIICNYIGYIISSVIKLIYSLLLRWYKAPYKYTHHPRKEDFKTLVQDGLPLLISGYVWTIFNIADQTYIAIHFTTNDLGLYNIARLCTMAIVVIPNAINSMLYPRASEVYGKTDDPHYLFPFWKKSLILYIIIMIPIVAIGYISIPYIVKILMPEYIGGIKAAKIAILTGITYVYFGPSVIFGTLKKVKSSLIFQILLLGAFWGICLIFDSHIKSIEDVAWLRFILFVILCIFNIGISLKYVLK